MGGRHADELLPAPFQALSPPSSSAAPRCAAAGPLLCGRHSPIAGAILFLGIGAVSAAVACRTGCAFSHRRLPFLGSRGLSSARMESASTTVPSIVVYVTVPNREAGKKLSQSIISEKLAACVNIVPGLSLLSATSTLPSPGCLMELAVVRNEFYDLHSKFQTMLQVIIYWTESYFIC